MHGGHVSFESNQFVNRGQNVVLAIEGGDRYAQMHIASRRSVRPPFTTADNHTIFKSGDGDIERLGTDSTNVATGKSATFVR